VQIPKENKSGTMRLLTSIVRFSENQLPQLMLRPGTDETGLFWERWPTKTMAAATETITEGFKPNNNSVSILICEMHLKHKYLNFQWLEHLWDM
jgi:hypothetical protein